MPPPTLDQVLNFFRDHSLPADVDPSYRGTTVSGLPACGPDDSASYRMLGYPNDPNNAIFLPPNQVSATAPFLNPDDAFLRRLLTGTGGLVYQREGRGAGGARVPMGPGTLHLCRSESPIGTSGRYTVSVSENAVINNSPGNPAPLRRVAFSFRSPEIEAIVHGLRRTDGTAFALPGDHYLVDPTNHSQLSLMPDRNELDQLITMIQAPNSPIAADRRAPIVAALREFIRTEATQADVLDEQRRWPPALIAGLSVVASIIPSVALMIWMQRRNEKLMREMQQGPQVNTTELFVDPTDDMRSKDRVTIPDSQRRYVDAVRSRFNQGQFAHVVLSGPSGSGKSYTADLIGKLAVNGQLGVEGFQNQPVRFVRIDANDIIRSAGSWQNGAQARFFEVLNRLTTETNGPLIIHLLEADKFAAAGQGAGNQPLNLLKELYTIMEGVNPQYRNVHFILDSTRWQTIQTAAPDMLRRAQFMEIIPTTPEDLRSAIESGVRSRRTSHKDDRIRARFERVTFSPEALDAITAMGEYRDGAPPSSHLSMVDTLAEEASQHSTGAVTITREHVLRLVARDRALPIATVRAQFAERMGTTGIRQNPRIQAAIQEGFYRAYPEPMRGRVNPMDLAAVADANPASLFGDAPPVDPTPRVDTAPRPAVVTPPPLPTATIVDGAVIHGADAHPTDNISRDVVRSQLVLRYPRFLSQAAREALLDGNPLPTGPDLVNSAFTREIDALTNRVVAQYHIRMDSNRADIDTRWAEQARDHNYVVRDGVPDSFLREQADAYFTQEAARASSPFGGGAATSFRADAAHDIDVADFERHMELLRHIGR